MIMKRILYYIWILPLMLSGCEKDLMDYEGLEGVYFAVQWGDSWGSEKTWPYQPYTNVNFISLPGDTATLSVKVMATGPVYEHFDASLHTLRIADFMVEPKVWVGTAVSPYNGGYESGNWGAFSRKKLELICERFNLTYNDFMSNETMPSALQMLIYKSMSTYLIQCYNDKKPVLEEDGRLMWFSGCPWLSKVGVPWVPEEGYYD